MKASVITAAAYTAVIVYVISTRILLPLLRMGYYLMLKQFEPIEPAEVIPLPVAVVETPAKATPAKKRASRKRVTKPAIA